MAPSIEWTFNAYTVGTTSFTLLFAMAGFYFVTKSDMKLMKENVIAIKRDLESLTELMRDVAVQKTEIENLRNLVTAQAGLIKTHDERLYALSQGRGWIQREIDGEYT